MNAYNYTIKDIENMSAANLADMADEVETIKGYTVYFVDFGGAFGFSACVCAEGQHIYHANDYELHHRGKSRDELREIYRRKLTGILFTESELSTVSGYDDKSVKEYFLRNLYAMRRPHVSMFHIAPRILQLSESDKMHKTRSWQGLSLFLSAPASRDVNRNACTQQF